MATAEQIPTTQPNLLDNPEQLCFTGLFLTPEEHERLLADIEPVFSNVFADHVTIHYYGDDPTPIDLDKLPVGIETTVPIRGKVVDTERQVQALIVDYPIPGKAYPHITISTGEDSKGAAIKPEVSNAAIADAVANGSVEPLPEGTTVSMVSGYCVGDYDKGRGTIVTSSGDTYKQKPSELDDVIKRMHMNLWPEYTAPGSEILENEVTPQDNLPSTLPTSNVDGEIVDFRFGPEIDADKDTCIYLATKLCDEAFSVCNPRVGNALKTELIRAIDTVRDAHDLQTMDKSAQDTDAEITLQSLTQLLTTVLVMLGLEDYQEATDYGTLVKPWISNYLRRRDGMIAIEYASSQDGYNTYADNDEYDSGDIPGSVILSVKPNKRVNLELTTAPPSLEQKYTSKIEHRGQFEQSSLSLRIDRDEASPTGYSLDFGRDRQNNDKYKRSADAAGSSVGLVRPGKGRGSHFTDAFAEVTDVDFEEFTRNLEKILNANIDMQRYDEHLRQRSSLGQTAYRAA